MKYLLFPFAFTAFIGCNTEESGSYSKDIKNIPVSFASTKEIVFTNDLIDSIHYIKLEDTQESIGEISKLIVEDGKIIVWDNARKNIWTFSDKGKFIGRISHLGNGPGKYAVISNVSFAKPDKIYIVDGLARSVNTYTIHGNFVEKVPTQGNISDYLISAGRTYSFYYYRFKKKHNYLSIQESDHSKVGFFAYQRPFLFIGGGGDMLVKRGDEIYFRQPYNDTLYSYFDRTLTARYVFQFGANAFPTTALYAADNLKQADSIMSAHPYEGNVSNLILSRSHMVGTYHQQRNSGQMTTAVIVYNMQTDSAVTYRFLGGVDHQVVPNYPLATDGEQFYALSNSPGVETRYMKESADSVKPGINSNPIILKYKYKL